MNKFNKFKKDLSDLYTDDVPINLSPSLSYRSRCEFGYYKNYYTMKDNFKTVYLKTNLPWSLFMLIMFARTIMAI